MSDWLALISNIEFEWLWAIALLPLPLLATWRSQANTEHYVAPNLPLFEIAQHLHLGSTSNRQQSKQLKKLIATLCWLALVVACMRPTYVGEQVDIPLSGRDLMLAIDISPSMQEEDLQLKGKAATRLDVVKSVVNEFVGQRNGDRIGLILFGSTPYIQAPLSFDVETINTLLQESYLGMAGRSTAIGDAIALGVKRLRQRPEQSRVLILLSDGANTAGEIPPEKAAQLAEQENIKIYTIGVGADEVLRRSFFGTRKVNPSADLDEDMLKQIAGVTGGQYFRARSTEQLQQIYSLINDLEPVEQETRSYRPTKALYFYCLGFSLCLYLLFMLSSQFQKAFRRLNTSLKQHSTHKGDAT